MGSESLSPTLICTQVHLDCDENLLLPLLGDVIDDGLLGLVAFCWCSWSCGENMMSQLLACPFRQCECSVLIAILLRIVPVCPLSPGVGILVPVGALVGSDCCCVVVVHFHVFKVRGCVVIRDCHFFLTMPMHKRKVLLFFS